MAKKIIKAQMKQRRDTRANWAATNPVLLDGELGIVSDDPNLYKVGDGTTAWNNLPFRGFDGTLVHETGSSDTAVMSQKAVTEALTDLEQELNDKVDLKGRYPKLSVGFADDLVGRGESTPAEFSFRASGGKSIKDGAARIKRLRGNSVVWNQLAKPFQDAEEKPYGGEVTYLNKGVTISNLPAYNPYRFDIGLSRYRGRKILVLLDYENDNASQLLYLELGGENSVGFSVSTIAWFITAEINEENAYRDYFSIYTAEDSTGNITLRNLRIIDLTREFGAGYEPTTKEEYYARKPIVVDESAYSEGEVIHMTAEGIKSVGDNAWDEEWKYDGGYVQGVNSVRVLPNTEYYVSSPDYVVITVYDKDDTLLATHERKNSAFTTPANASYLRLRLSSSYGTTYNNDIMITLVHSGWKQDTDAGYQPYWEDRLMFDERIKEHFPDGMKKWDMVYNKNGKGYIVKGTGVVDLGELEWGTIQDGQFYSHEVLGNIGYMQLICARYTTAAGSYADMEHDKTIGNNKDYPYNMYLFVRDDDYTDAATFKSAMAGVLLYHQLAEPTIIEYDDPFNLDYKVADFGTEEAIADRPSAPIAADIIYQFNAVDMIRELWLKVQELEARLNG